MACRRFLELVRKPVVVEDLLQDSNHRQRLLVLLVGPVEEERRFCQEDLECNCSSLVVCLVFDRRQVFAKQQDVLLAKSLRLLLRIPANRLA